MRDLTISVTGLGYVGLSTAVAFASRGLRVTGYDVDEAKVAKINRGETTFHEPRVGEMLRASLKRGFRASAQPSLADVYFITVGTPSLPDGGVDLSFVMSAARDIGRALGETEGYRLVVVKSTVPPGTTEGVVKPLIESESGRSFGPTLGLAMNPEFLREGSAIEDSLHPDRIVVGETDVRSGDSLLKLYKRVYGPRMPKVLRTNPVNAELIKYANNSFLATKVSYINMVANLCEKIPGADVEVIARGIGMDKRIGKAFLRAGAGWGGSCWPKDLMAMKSKFREVGVDAPLIDAAQKVNDSQPLRLVQAAKELLGDITGKKIAVLGLSFKPDTDDIRGAVSLSLIRALLTGGALVRVYDPVAMDSVRDLFHQEIDFASSPIEAIRGSECCILVTEWEEFGMLRPRDFASNMLSPVVVDGRRVFDPAKMRGVQYAAVGLGKATAREYRR